MASVALAKGTKKRVIIQLDQDEAKGLLLLVKGGVGTLETAIEQGLENTSGRKKRVALAAILMKQLRQVTK